MSLLLFGAFLGAPSTVRADREESALAWGMLAAELSTAGVIAGNVMIDGWPSQGPGLALNFTPMWLGPAVGYLGHRNELDPTAAYAVHGSSMLGLELFMLGTVIDGLDEQDGLRVGKTAWSLGVVGAVGGAVLGSTQIDGSREAVAFYAGPVGGLFAGGVIIGGAAALMSEDSNKAAQRFMLGGAIGMGLGFLGSVLYASLREAEPNESAGFSSTVPVVDLGRERTIFSLGGSF